MTRQESVPIQDLLGPTCKIDNLDGRNLQMETDGGVLTCSVEQSMNKSCTDRILQLKLVKSSNECMFYCIHISVIVHCIRPINRTISHSPEV